MCCVMAHVAAGFYYIKIKGKRATPKEAPFILIAPHSGFFDALPYTLLTAPTIVVKADVLNAPLFGGVFSYLSFSTRCFTHFCNEGMKIESFPYEKGAFKGCTMDTNVCALGLVR